MKALDIRGLSFTYPDGTEALRDLTLSLDVGEKIAIIGPNGAGKSTLLHLISGFRTPFSGEVTVYGKRLGQKTADSIRKDLGLVFQDPDDQIFLLTVEEDVGFGPRNLGLADIEGRVRAGLRSCGIEGLEKRQVQNLSYGMKKRVAIAGVMAMDPRLVLLDEPTSGLDPRSRAEFIRLLKGMDRSIVIASHDIEAAAEIVDRAVILNINMIAQGTMGELVRSPEILEAAGLEPPPISKLFRVLNTMGYPIDELPVSMDQAVAQLSKVMESKGVHAHVHTHEHLNQGGNGHTHPHSSEDQSSHEE